MLLAWQSDSFWTPLVHDVSIYTLSSACDKNQKNIWLHLGVHFTILAPIRSDWNVLERIETDWDGLKQIETVGNDVNSDCAQRNGGQPSRRERAAADGPGARAAADGPGGRMRRPIKQ